MNNFNIKDLLIAGLFVLYLFVFYRLDSRLKELERQNIVMTRHIISLDSNKQFLNNLLLNYGSDKSIKK